MCGGGAWERTDWPAIVALYDDLLAVNPSPVVALNKAIAVSMVSLADGWVLLDAITELESYPPLWAARADVLRRLGRDDEAAVAYRRAAALGTNEPERRFLLRRADECDRSSRQGEAS